MQFIRLPLKPAARYQWQLAVWQTCMLPFLSQFVSGGIISRVDRLDACRHFGASKLHDDQVDL